MSVENDPPNTPDEPVPADTSPVSPVSDPRFLDYSDHRYLAPDLDRDHDHDPQDESASALTQIHALVDEHPQNEESYIPQEAEDLIDREELQREIALADRLKSELAEARDQDRRGFWSRLFAK